jgi:peptidylprolyl isomerase
MKAVSAGFLLSLLVLAGCGGADAPAGNSTEAAAPNTTKAAAEALGRGRPQIPVPRGRPPRRLVVKDLVKGSGASARPGDLLTVEYFGIRYTGGTFANSWDNGHPFEFRLGSDDPAVSPGWEKGLEGMKVGGRRQLILPPELLYHGGAPPDVRPDEAVVYEIDLLRVNRPRVRCRPPRCLDQ